MSDEPASPVLPPSLARALREAIRLAAQTETDARTRREVLAHCEAVLLRLELGAGSAAEIEPEAASVRERLGSLRELAPPERTALWSELTVYAQREAARRERTEAQVAAALAAPAPRPAAGPTREAVQEYLQRRFADAPPRVTACTEVPGGRSKLTVMLSLAHTGSLPREVVLRCDRPGSAQSTSVRDEFPVLQAMFRAGAFAPEPLWLEADPAPLGVCFLAMRRMPGSARGDYWSAGETRPVHARALARALACIHAAEPRQAWPDAPAMAQESTAALIATYETRWRAACAPTSVMLELGYTWLKDRLQCLMGASVAVHGDCHFANVLYEDAHISCLTDWEFAHAGHPAEDLAFCRSYVEAVMPWGEFLAEYCAGGGREISQAELVFFRVWTYLRNATLGAVALRGVLEGRTSDIRTVAIAVHARARLEAALAHTLAAELAPAPPR